jgi:hypothetical protein
MARNGTLHIKAGDVVFHVNRSSEPGSDAVLSTSITALHNSIESTQDAVVALAASVAENSVGAFLFIVLKRLCV